MKKFSPYFLVFILLFVFASCKEEVIEAPVAVADGISFQPVAPDADGELTIIFKA